MNDLQSDSVHAFGVFASEMNFTSAARILHLSQPALHVKVQNLAKAIGETLYERRGRRLMLTPVGEALAEFARESQKRADVFLNQIKSPEDRPVVLLAGRGAFMNVIDVGVAAELKRGTNLRLLVDHVTQNINMVEDGRVDVAVGVFESVPNSLTETPIGSYGAVLVVPKSHDWANRSSVKLRDLDDLPLVVPPESFPYRKLLSNAFVNDGFRLNVATEVDGWDLLMHMAKLGVAPAIATACIRLPAGVVSIPVKGLPKVTYSALSRQNASQPVKNFISRLKEKAT